MIILSNRALISLSGSDRKSFLQGLISNDVNKVSENNAIYAVMLSPQGRFLYDFFIIQFQDRLLLDCNRGKMEEIIKKLSVYKLRANVQIAKEENMVVGAIIPPCDDVRSQLEQQNIVNFVDPRSDKLGIRIIALQPQLANPHLKPEASIDLYNSCRINLKIADDSDLTFDHSLILEYGFDHINAIDYKKGCYVGQEVTARTHYRGLIRKTIYLIAIDNLKEIALGSKITCDNKNIGIILSSVFYEDKLKALALIKDIDSDNQKIDLSNADLFIDQQKITLIN